MKYTTEIIIDLPREQVIEKLNNPENMKHWQRGLIGYELLEGTPGTKGAKMKLDYVMGKRNMSLVETITDNNFPSEFHATYDTKGVHNVQRNYFVVWENTKTKWISESEFQFSSLGMKFLGWLMPGAFKKQSMTYLTDFKNFAEQGTSVSDTA